MNCGKTICHRNGTVSYWSVYEQRYYRETECIDQRELATMSWEEREKVLRHLRKNGWYEHAERWTKEDV